MAMAKKLLHNKNLYLVHNSVLVGVYTHTHTHFHCYVYYSISKSVNDLIHLLHVVFCTVW